MKRKCFDIGTIQAFIDGEVSGETAASIAEHAAACDECAARIASAEEETAMVFSVLDREVNTLVPTQRLWTRINDSLADERKPSFGQRLAGVFASLFAQPSFAVTAGVFLIFAFGAFYFITNGISVNDAAAPNDIVASVPSAPKLEKKTVENAGVSTSEPNTAVSGDTVARPLNESRSSYQIETANYKASPRRQVETRSRPMAKSGPRSAPAVYLPGEESYVKTIAGLKRNIDDNKDLVMPAATRVSYERDMAVVNDTIGKLKSAVAKDPTNEAAKQALYASYQDKIDLLNSVQQREELMASLR
jgi:hypothetical protein